MPRRDASIRCNGELVLVDRFDMKQGIYRALEMDEQCESCGQPLGDSAITRRSRFGWEVVCGCNAIYTIKDA